MLDFHRWPQDWPWVLIIPVYLFALWFILGATVAFVYWLKKRDNEKAKKWLLYSLAALLVAGFAYGIWWGVKSGKFFKI